MELPEVIVKEIQSYVGVSWRAEYHYFKLMAFMKSRTIDNVPNQDLVEHEDHYIYHHGKYHQKLYKKDHNGVSWAKNSIVSEYLHPLREYLFLYRYHQIHKAWKTRPFELFGFHVGEMDPVMYGLCLIDQAYREGSDEERSWKGCLPLDQYKKAWCNIKLMNL